MKPLSKETAELFRPADIDESDRCRLTVSNELDKFVADFWSLPSANGRYPQTYKYMPSTSAQHFINRFAERKKVTTGYSPYAWEFAATDYTVELIDSLWPKDKLEFHDEETKSTFDFILARSTYADICAEINAQWKANKTVPEHWYEFSEERPLSPYQQVAMYCGLQSPGYGFFMEQGTGKTPPAIAIICNAAKYLAEQIAAGEQPYRMYRGLVVCPNNVRLNWQNEIQLFATVPGQVTVLRGPEVDRVKQLIDAFTAQKSENPDEPSPLFTLVVCGYETLSRSWDALSMVDWDISILDEGHSIRSIKTKRNQTAMKLRDKSQQRLVLTGTPIANSALDLFALFEFMGKGYSGFSSFEHWKEFYGNYEVTESGHRALVSIQNAPYMKERLARYSFIIRKDEALPDLPQKQYDIYEVEMSEQQREYYREVAAKLALEIEADLSNDSMPRSMVINNVLTKLLRLTQITSGFVSWGESFDDFGELLSSARIEYFVPNPKIEAIREIASTKTKDNKTIVWACFTPDIEYLESMAQQDGLDYVTYTGKTKDAQRKIAEDRFNCDPNCQWLFGNAAAGGQGLNLLGYDKLNPDKYTTNADHVIYYSQNWSAIARQQSEDRANRRGTRVPTRITDLVVPGTVDEDIRARVVGKKLHAMDITDLRRILHNVLAKELA